MSKISGFVEEKSSQFKSAVYETSKEILGCDVKNHEDWFDDNDPELSRLLQERNQARANMLNRTTRATKAKFRHLSRLLQKRCRMLKNQWWQTKAAELQENADLNDMRGFYHGIKASYGPKVSYPDQLLALDNITLLTEKKDLLTRWTEHFNTLLNEVSDVNLDIPKSLEQSTIQTWMDDCPDMMELCEVIDSLSNGKSPGADGIHPEVIKRGGQTLLEKLYEIKCDIWQTGLPPQDWKDAQLITLYKKGDRRQCGNYRGISLLSIAGKIFARIFLNRLSKHAESFLPEAQCGFRAGRGTVDMIFSLKQIQEKCIEQNMGLYMVFVDFTKAFDTVNRAALWIVLKKLGCPKHFTTLVSALHSGMKARVWIKGELSDPFSVRNGVKQGCVLAPTLFSIYLAVVLQRAFNNCVRGVLIQSRPGADLFNVNQFKSTRSTQGLLIREFMFADDTAFVAHNHAHAQEIITRFAAAAKDYGLKINIKKTEVLYQPSLFRQILS